MIKSELKKLLDIVKELDKKVVVVFLAVAVLQTISWYYTSRMFFRANIFNRLEYFPNIYLIEYLYWFIGDFFVFFILSALIIKFVLKEKVKAYGLTVGDFSVGIKFTLLFLVIMVPIVWVVSSYPEFAATYPQYKSARESWVTFFIFETGMLIYMFAWEFIWRGFMLFGLEKKFGYYTVFIQMIPFLILHNGKPAGETFGAIIAGVALGVLALRTRSFLYGVIIHEAVMFSINLFSTLRYKAGDYGIGINSMIKLVKEIF
ncbi:MAG: CPBP family intramembrane metalloprotease [Ignavibacteriaceae bacterium]|nr:CPBP family intramembrane metalloprotease [Ignavibacteriaceae bacterium]